MEILQKTKESVTNAFQISAVFLLSFCRPCFVQFFHIIAVFTRVLFFVPHSIDFQLLTLNLPYYFISVFLITTLFCFAFATISNYFYYAISLLFTFSLCLCKLSSCFFIKIININLKSRVLFGHF